LLPDLVMPPLSDVSAATRDGGQASLLFSASIANVGRGPLLVHAVRSSRWRENWRVSQRFDERDGSTTERVTRARLVWGGHGHEHWHVRFGASYSLEVPARFGGPRRIRKAGFCFFDQLRQPSAPVGRPRRFSKETCSGHASTTIEMGLSPGWQDPYYWILPDQRIDITGLPDGVYRLRATADPDRVLRESSEANNGTWADVRIDADASPATATVVRTSASP
jgi:hypothetical protein